MISCTDDVGIKVIFVPFKICQSFSLKDPPLKSLKSSVVYKFVCPGCNASYVGETARHLSTGIIEHLEKDKNSHIFKHLENSSLCKELANFNSFSILDTASSKFQLRIKEGMYIHWLKPVLNKQVNCFKTSLIV